jgi:hypothetical protein
VGGWVGEGEGWVGGGSSSTTLLRQTHKIKNEI